MIHIADWDSGEDLKTFQTEKEAMEWINHNCESCGDDGIYYLGNRIEMY